MDPAQSVEMISVCSEDGSMQPLRFRFHDEDGCAQVARVLEILSCREVKYVNVEAYVYTCRVRTDEREQISTVRYSVRSHQWLLAARPS